MRMGSCTGSRRFWSTGTSSCNRGAEKGATRGYVERLGLQIWSVGLEAGDQASLASARAPIRSGCCLADQDRSGRKQDRSGRKQDRSGRKQDQSGRKQDSGHVRRMRRRMAEATSAAATSADTAVRAAADVAAAESEELEREMAAAANAIMAAGAPGSAAAAESRTSADGSSEGVADYLQIFRSLAFSLGRRQRPPALAVLAGAGIRRRRWRQWK